MPTTRRTYATLAAMCAGAYFTTATPWLALPAVAAEVATQSAAAAQNPAQVLRTMERVADWQLAHPTGYPLEDWTEGVGDAGMMALAGISGSDRYLQAMRRAAEQNAWRLGPSMYHADDYVVGQTYAELYQHFREPHMIAPMRAQFDYMLAHPRPGSLNWKTPGVQHRWSWCDALFMGPPAWARLSAVTGDARYLEFAIQNWWLTSDYLYDREEHLYFRDSRFFGQREANGAKVFWGRGNGWVMGGLVRMLQYIPAQHAQRERFVQQYREMAQRLLGLQQADGLWRSSLLDPASYPNRESSGTALYTYALAWGVNQGLLPRSEFEPAVRKAWQALASHVTAEGKLIHVQPIGEDPRKFDPQSTDVFAVGAFLLAGSELYRMGLVETAGVHEISVANPSNEARLEQSVEWPLTQPVQVMDALTSRILPSQRLNNGVLFQTDLAAGETRRFLLLPRQHVPAAPPVRARAHARFVPERLDDFAWENDKVAHRTYGPAVMRDPKEQLVSSGIDVWSKSVRKLVLDDWYQRADYHQDHGEGLDFYHVGTSRGCGGLGIYAGNQLYTSQNFSQWKVLADGPLRAEFELRFERWDAAGRPVAEVRRVQLDAGSHFSRVESRFSSTQPGPLVVGVGIAQRAGEGQYRQNADSMSYWEPAMDNGGNGGGNGSNACAVIMPQASGFVAQQGHYLALGSAQPQAPFIYYLGAAWSKGGDVADAAAWQAQVAAAARRYAQPLKVQQLR
ncbi:glycoside hydrolase family 88 protein [Duganella fentianensis]|uniref:glycoside hydrolase family 88 protein n=1 Tax=Duganella fentianensis TaxID=2692177 RepID=UPI0032B196C1